MSADSIEWHEQCYKNAKATLDRMHEALAAEQIRFEINARRVAYYRRQIDRAKRMRKTSFDAERFKDE